MDLKKTWELVKSAASSWIDDYAPSMGAALSYYTVFSLAPVLLIVIAVAGMVFGEEAARGAVFAQLTGLMGADAAKAVEGLLADVGKPKQGTLATMFGVIVERYVALAVVRTFSQHVGFDDAGECVGRQLGMRHYDGRQRALVFVQVAYFLMSSADPARPLDTASMIHSSCFSGLAITRGM